MTAEQGWCPSRYLRWDAWDMFYTPGKASEEANGFPWELDCFSWGEEGASDLSGGADLCSRVAVPCTRSPWQLERADRLRALVEGK